MIKHLKMFMQDEDGASAVEYGLLVALIAAAIILTVQTLGTTLNGVFGGVNTTLSATIPSSN
ncbi:MAG: Flp family type IVb pilin [Nitrospinae bacterium]|nr:Flp family type IVb pilin [Nitrospinota bacterium]